jgi:hypothetical protein
MGLSEGGPGDGPGLPRDVDRPLRIVLTEQLPGCREAGLFPIVGADVLLVAEFRG